MDSPPQKIIVAFYASTRFGSEYRAGVDFILIAAELGFNQVIVSDIERNDSPEDIARTLAPGACVTAIPSPLRKQSLLYRFSDFIPQVVWHHRVARHLRRSHPGVEVLWVQNGALPWLPLAPYLGIARHLVWGPVGGGEPPCARSMRALPRMARWREQLRSALEAVALRRKRKQLQSQSSRLTPVLALARTVGARERLRALLPAQDIPVIPEILEPVKAATLHRQPRETPRFLWVGQDVPRKNLDLALSLFATLKRDAFPRATLDVFGVQRAGAAPAGVRFHGWVAQIDWEAYRHDGVLLLTSFREGMPSAVLEAASHGLLSITSDVGALASLQLETIKTLPRAEYPSYSLGTLQAMVSWIRHHLSCDTISLRPIDHRQALRQHLNAHGIHA
jgi:glycosyltransferase involved in cell wall biosynthesis